MKLVIVLFEWRLDSKIGRRAFSMIREKI